MTEQQYTILIVDDEPANILLLEESLKNDYLIIACQNGFDAIDLIKQQHPDLVLLDVMMPDLNGFDVCRVVKAEPEFAAIPIVILTSLDSQEGEFEGISAGGIEYLRKPINIELLKLRVRNLLELRRQHDLISRQRDELSLMVTELEEKNEQQRIAEQEKLALQYQLQQAQRLDSLGVLASGIAHDFNNLLQIITGNIQMMILDYPQLQALDSTCEIDNAIEQAAGLCRDMLTYAGKSQVSRSVVNVGQLVHDMVKIVRSSITQKIELVENVTSDTYQITGNAVQIRQIIMNLLINASEAIGDRQGYISIRLQHLDIDDINPKSDYVGKKIAPGHYVCLEVADTGCGMSEEVLQRIFEPFYSTKFAGRGLGLATLLGIVAGHKGAVNIASVEGKGAIIRIYLPSLPNEAGSHETPPPREKKSSWRGSGTILLVEDEKQVLVITKRILELLGFEVIPAREGRSALQLFETHRKRITLIMTDIGMPVMDGYELIQEIRKRDRTTPVVVLTGFGNTDVLSRIEAGAIAGFVSKPYDMDKLCEVIRNLIEPGV